MAYFAFDSVIYENTFELFGFSIASVVMSVGLIYGIIQEYHRYEVLITSSVVLGFQSIQLLLLLPLYNSFGWRLYRIIGTDEKLVRMYKLYCFFITLVKVDVLLTLLVLLMGLFFVQFDWWISYVGLSIGTALCILSAPICVIGVRKEKLSIVILWCLWAMALPGYLIYKIANFWIVGKIHQWNGSTLHDKDLKIMLTVLSASTILTRFFLCITVIIAATNFGKGLRDIYQRDRKFVNPESASLLDKQAAMKIGPNGEIIFQGEEEGETSINNNNNMV
jgi:hypothetical protein